jgi:cell division protein FtsQ
MTRRKNIKKKPRIDRQRRFWRQIETAVYLPLGLVGVMFFSAVFIFIHDYLTQTAYFGLKQLTVDGSQQLSREEVARCAGIRPGMNVLALNLNVARRRLLAHPWIAEAEIERRIPGGIRIRIEEHRPAAIVELDRRYLMDDRGTLFKTWQTSDAASLPVVTGLAPRDLILHQVPETGNGLLGLGQKTAGEPQPGRPLAAVLEVLQLGSEPGSALPNRSIRKIQVDRQTGLTILTGRTDRQITLGYQDYPRKYRMLSRLISHARHSGYASGFNRIDLNNLSRIVVNPVGLLSQQAREQGG